MDDGPMLERELLADDGECLRLSTVALLGTGDAVDGALVLYELDPEALGLVDELETDFAAAPRLIHRRLLDLVHDFVEAYRYHGREGAPILGEPRYWMGDVGELEERLRGLRCARVLHADLLEAATCLGEVIARTEAFDWAADDEAGRQREIRRLEGRLAELRQA
jgi:hypothetical protein